MEPENDIIGSVFITSFTTKANCFYMTGSFKDDLEQRQMFTQMQPSDGLS